MNVFLGAEPAPLDSLPSRVPDDTFVPELQEISEDGSYSQGHLGLTAGHRRPTSNTSHSVVI